MLRCSSICGMPKPPGTKRNNGKHQEHADNYRNMQISSARKKQIKKLRSRYCKLQNADSCNKRQSSNTGAAVLAPLGAFGFLSKTTKWQNARSKLVMCESIVKKKMPKLPPRNANICSKWQPKGSEILPNGNQNGSKMTSKRHPERIG